MIPRGLNRFDAQFMVIGSRDHNQCHSQRVDETALRTSSASCCWMSVISQITPEGNDVSGGEVYERSWNLGHDSIKSTLWDLQRPSPLLSSSVCEKIGHGDIIGIHFLSPDFDFSRDFSDKERGRGRKREKILQKFLDVSQMRS